MEVPATDELAECLRPLSGRIWRVVEHQYTAATRKLVDSRADQERLERLLEQSKPPVPESARHLHYLLQTPFRYRPPKPHGSRFRPPGVQWGIFYAAERRYTALAEFIHHRYRFFAASEGTDLPRTEERLTLFAADYATDRGLDLTREPLVRARPLWTDPDDYAACQRLGRHAREAGTGALRYESVRDPGRRAGKGTGRNVGVLDPGTFRQSRPVREQTWYLYLGRTEANVHRAGRDPSERHDFRRSRLLGAGGERNGTADPVSR